MLDTENTLDMDYSPCSCLFWSRDGVDRRRQWHSRDINKKESLVLKKRSWSLTGFPNISAVNCVQWGQARSSAARECTAVVGECCCSKATQPISMLPLVVYNNVRYLRLKRHKCVFKTTLHINDKSNSIYFSFCACYGSVHKMCTISSRKGNTMTVKTAVHQMLKLIHAFKHW